MKHKMRFTKRTVAILVLLTTGALGAYGQSRRLLPPSRVFLARSYAGLNTAYWGGKLPKDTVVSLGVVPNDNMANTVRDDAGRFRITIDWESNQYPNVLRLTMFHEMAHIATWGAEFSPHGTHWRKEMHRLADAGAFDEIW